MLKKKTLLVIVAVLFLLVLSPAAWAKPDIEGEAGILMDMKTGKVLWTKNPDIKRASASTTKILTALVALEKGNLQDLVKVSSNVKKIDGTKVWLRPGEEVTLENLLYAMLVNSANDAALAIAEHIGGSVEGFAKMMNTKAKELGAKNSHFVNPHGLDQEGHYTTARDLAIIAREAMNNEKFREIVQTKKKEWNGMDWKSHLVNNNKLLWQYEGATGVKTGYTSNAGRCLVASARKGEQEFLSVVLGSTTQAFYEDSMALLDYGFDNFKQVTLVEKGQKVSEIRVAGQIVPVVAAESFELLVDKGNFVLPKWEIQIKKSAAPIKKDRKIGTLSLIIEDKEIASVPLLAGSTVPKGLTWLDWYFRVTAAIFGLVFLSLLIKILRKRKKSKIMYGGSGRSTSLDYRAMRKL